MGQMGEMRGMTRQKVLATVQLLKNNDSLGDAILVALGALFLLLPFTFYPLYLVPALAAVAGIAAYKHAPIGTLMGMLFAIPAMSYQAPVLAWVFFIALAIALFEVFDHWSTIAFLEIAILAPFAPAPFNLLSGFLFLALGIAAMRFGSKHSFAVSLPAIFVVLLFSSLWLQQTASFITISKDQNSLYGPPMDELRNNVRPEVALSEVFSTGAIAIGSLFSIDNMKFFGPALYKIYLNTSALILQDSAIAQLCAWAAALFICAYLPGHFDHRFRQTISSFALFLVPIANFFIAPAFNNPFEPMSFAYCSASIAVIAVMEYYSFSLSRERIVVRREKQKAFNKFGLQDLGESRGVDSLEDIGGYESVKAELHEAIIAPLKSQELVYTYGLEPPNGVLLFGPPGTGKTLLMKALAKEMNIGFYYVKCSELLSEWYGESLPYDEKIVILEDGRTKLAKIGEVVEQRKKAKVLSFDQHGKALFAEIKNHIKHRCTSPIYEVRTRTGRRIRVTGYHSLFTLKDGRIESVRTDELVPKQSYVAIPSSIPLAGARSEKIDFLGFLAKDDFSLYVKNVQESLKSAVKKLGEEKACKILGLKSAAYLRQVIRSNIGARAGRFLLLMREAGLEYDAAEAKLFSRKAELSGEIRIDEELAFFLGLWVAEGSYNREDTVRISTSEKEIAPIAALCRRLFGRITVYEKKNSKGRDIYIASRALYVFMRHYLGLQDGADRKKAPEIAFSFSGENLAAFLRGYFSGDGSVYENQKGFATVEASTASHELADQLLYLLLYFGIVGTVYDKHEWSGTLSKRICLTGEPLRRFADTIGFFDRGRQERLLRASKLGGWHRGAQIPLFGMPQKLIDGVPSGSVGYDTIGNGIVSQHMHEFDADEFSDMLQSDIHWDRVEEISRVADEEHVYDISVEPCQNFAGGSGGIFAHNSEKNISEVFSIARKKAPCVLFFDEIDSIGKRRNSYTSDDVAPRVMSVMLEELDGFKSKKNVITIGATNAPDQLDPALMRPGRFDKIIYMPLPDLDARKAIFKVHLKKLPHDEDIDYPKLAAMTERFSGADIKNICTESSRLAAREAVQSNVVVNISMKHLTTTIKKLKPSVSLDQLETYDKFRMDYERRSDAEEKKPDEQGVRWEDVAGLADVRAVLLEAIEMPLLHEDVMKEMDVKASKGLLLFGPPGCGKTMIVKAAANELKANFLTISGAELMKGKNRSAAVAVKETFNRARESAPALVFIDEIEALAPNRDEFSGGILTELLQELDGVKELKNVMLIGATNKPSALDPAILRPGRFDKIIYIPPPDAPARTQIFTTNLSKFLKGLDLKRLSEATEGFSGADVSSVCQEVKMQLVRDKLKGKPAELTGEQVMKVISSRRPSITKKDLKSYDEFKEEYGERK